MLHPGARQCGRCGSTLPRHPTLAPTASLAGTLTLVFPPSLSLASSLPLPLRFTLTRCRRCGYGPVTLEGCNDLTTHHGQVMGARADRPPVDNSCPRSTRPARSPHAPSTLPAPCTLPARSLHAPCTLPSRSLHAP